jgi:ElaA protein
MIIVKKKFKELSLKELYLILKIRQEVFIVEQRCFYLDCDDLDEKAIHFLGFKKGQLISYMRVLYNESMNLWTLGRILVTKNNRGKGLGVNIISEVIKILENLNPLYTFEMSAQTYLIDFYKKFNFCPVGNEYLDAGIPHIKMVKK